MMILPGIADTFNIAQDFPGRNSEKLRKQEKDSIDTEEKQCDFVKYPQNRTKRTGEKLKMIKGQMEMYRIFRPVCKVLMKMVKIMPWDLELKGISAILYYEREWTGKTDQPENRNTSFSDIEEGDNQYGCTAVPYSESVPAGYSRCFL